MSHEHELVGTVGEESESDATWNALITTERKVVEGLKHNNNNMCVGILHGVAPIWNHLKETFAKPKYIDIQQRIFATIINGYNGVGAEVPHVLIPLSQDLESAHLIFAKDDLIDSGKSIALFYEEIARLRGHEVDADIVKELSAIKRQPFEKFKPVFTRLIEHLHEEHIVVSTTFYKNKPFLDCLRSYLQTCDTDDDWAREQEDMLTHVLVFGQHDWVMGRGLDTGIRGNILAPMIREALKKLDLLDDSAEEILYYIEHSLIRVGSFVERLIVLKNDDIDGLTKKTAEYLTKYIMAFVQLRQNVV